MLLTHTRLALLRLAGALRLRLCCCGGLRLGRQCLRLRLRCLSNPTPNFCIGDFLNSLRLTGPDLPSCHLPAAAGAGVVLTLALLIVLHRQIRHDSRTPAKKAKAAEPKDSYMPGLFYKWQVASFVLPCVTNDPLMVTY